jgi:hypothetical protein
VLCTADCSVVHSGWKYATTPPQALVIICIGEKSNNEARNALAGCAAFRRPSNIGSKNLTTPPHALLIICIGEKSNRFLRNAITGTLKALSSSQIAENSPVSGPQLSRIMP